jgi:hypothetical protein
MQGFSVSGTGTKELQELASLYGDTVPVVLAQEKTIRTHHSTHLVYITRVLRFESSLSLSLKSTSDLNVCWP